MKERVEELKFLVKQLENMLNRCVVEIRLKRAGKNPTEEEITKELDKIPPKSLVGKEKNE